MNAGHDLRTGWTSAPVQQVSALEPDQYVDCDPDNMDGLTDGDVNISYATHPWARGRGVATAAVEQICDYIRANAIGTAAGIRVEPAKPAIGSGG